MSRNKILYALGDAAIIVRADLRSGGTWAGAEEVLRRENAIPVFVRAEGDGNRALVAMGARKLPPLPWSDLRATLRGRSESEKLAQATLFG